MPTRDTASRILDAAFERVNAVGLSRTTVEDVARTAGVTRQTVYRYFSSKDHLITMLLIREEERLLAGVRLRFDGRKDFEDGLADALLFCLRFARGHPLLHRLLATDAETLLPYLTTRAGPLIVRARSTVIDLLKARGGLSADLLDSCADALVRIVLSYAVTPPEDPPELVARDLARVMGGALTAEAGAPA
jgi:AcrR family transcriptional regulator